MPLKRKLKRLFYQGIGYYLNVVKNSQKNIYHSMSRYETISQTNIGEAREVDGHLNRPLKIHNIALTTPLSHEHYPLPVFSLSGAVSRSQPDLHGMTLVRAQNADEIIASVQINRPDILALSAHQGTLLTLDRTLESLNEFATEKLPQIILGGSLPTYLADRFFKKYPKLSLTIVGGWGEDAFAGEVKQHSIKDPEPNQKFVIGTYPEYYPKQEGVPTNGTVGFHYTRVEASRGCFWGACSYCLRPLNEKQGKWKQYEPKDVLLQITDLLKLGYTGYFEFADEEPIGTDIDRFQGIVNELIDLKKDYPTFTFGINMRADRVISPKPDKQEQYDEFLRKAKKAGLVNVWMGAESFSHPHLQVLHKGSYITPTTNLEAAKKISDNGISVSQGFIPYHPLSKWQELLEMANFMEPHASFLSKVLSSPFGFLRVQYNTPYEKTVRKLESSINRKLIGELDENMLTYQCKFQDPSIGLHATYMRMFYDWINPYLKQMNVEAMKGDKTSQNKLDQLRFIGLQLFLTSIKQLEPLKGDLAELERQQLLILDKYKREIGNFGINTADLDGIIQHHSSDYLDKFI